MSIYITFSLWVDDLFNIVRVLYSYVAKHNRNKESFITRRTVHKPGFKPVLQVSHYYQLCLLKRNKLRQLYISIWLYA